jgi:hypothetical protein
MTCAEVKQTAAGGKREGLGVILDFGFWILDLRSVHAVAIA